VSENASSDDHKCLPILQAVLPILREPCQKDREIIRPLWPRAKNITAEYDLSLLAHAMMERSTASSICARQVRNRTGTQFQDCRRAKRAHRGGPSPGKKVKSTHAPSAAVSAGPRIPLPTSVVEAVHVAKVARIP